ncbi:hypothetical protein FTX61_08530 [Nitriliruptoraceae bacterium ZYF776]|nr:hypothetical protein [Profundirhabdus halotolerans]
MRPPWSSCVGAAVATPQAPSGLTSREGQGCRGVRVRATRDPTGPAAARTPNARGSHGKPVHGRAGLRTALDTPTTPCAHPRSHPWSARSSIAVSPSPTTRSRATADT